MGGLSAVHAAIAPELTPLVHLFDRRQSSDASLAVCLSPYAPAAAEFEMSRQSR